MSLTTVFDPYRAAQAIADIDLIKAANPGCYTLAGVPYVATMTPAGIVLQKAARKSNLQTGATKEKNGVTYVFNENRRWARADKGKPPAGSPVNDGAGLRPKKTQKKGKKWGPKASTAPASKPVIEGKTGARSRRERAAYQAVATAAENYAPSLESLFAQADAIGSKYQTPNDPPSLSARRSANAIVDGATGGLTNEARGVADLGARRKAKGNGKATTPHPMQSAIDKLIASGKHTPESAKAAIEWASQVRTGAEAKLKQQILQQAGLIPSDDSTQPKKEPKAKAKAPKGKPSQPSSVTPDRVIDAIRELDQTHDTDNYLPIFHLRNKFPNLSRGEMDKILFQLQADDQIELGTLQDVSQYSDDEVNAGIPQNIGGAWFYISTNEENPQNQSAALGQQPKDKPSSKAKTPKSFAEELHDAKLEEAKSPRMRARLPKTKDPGFEQIKSDIFDYFGVATVGQLKNKGSFKMVTDGMDFDFGDLDKWKELYRKIGKTVPGEEQEQGRGVINGVNVLKYFRPWKMFGIDDPKSATDDDVRAAYKRLSKIYHPDILGTGDAEVFDKINLAYQSLVAGADADTPRSSSKPQAKKRSRKTKTKQASPTLRPIALPPAGDDMQKAAQTWESYRGTAEDLHKEANPDDDGDPCWKGYEAVGTKKKRGKTVPNCVPMAKALTVGGARYALDGFTLRRLL